MISSPVDALRVTASIGVRLPVRWLTRLATDQCLRTRSLLGCSVHLLWISLVSPLHSLPSFIPFFHSSPVNCINGCKMELSWESEQAATGGIREQGRKWFLKPSIKVH
uniref:Uncharacterized protein n=1 Tax=Oryza barthii TaxID=65489 RepID=A0A0D3GDN8_9ORYZ